MNIGRYELLEKLGQGGMGVVHRAFDTLLQRVVAVKLISGSVEAGTEQRERFFREARAAGQLSHRNIITIYDLGEHEGQPYLAMEYLEGEDLQRRIACPDRMSLAHKVDLAIEICEALEYAHARGIIHRDIKPANIFITSQGTARILDFGLARLVTSELTNSNMMMGTVNFMAPEQVRGERADQRSDIFSVGAVLYELLSGRKAFEGDSVAATMYKIVQEQPSPLASIEPALPRELVAVVERALAKPRDERYQSMSEVLRDLAVCRQLIAHEFPAFGRPAPATIPRPSDTPRPRLDADPGSDAPTVANIPTPVPASFERPSSGGSVRAALASASAAVQRRPRTAVWIAAAGLIVATAAFAVWSVQSRAPGGQPQAPPTAPPADAALALAPDPAEARRVRERAATMHESVTRGLRDARAHYEAGRFEQASRAAGDVLSLAPEQAEARTIMQDAAARSRGRGADDARTRMNQAKAAARAASAASLAASSYDAALGAERTAQRLYDAGQLADATAKFYEASGLFRSTELAAQSEAARRTERAAAADAEKERAAREAAKATESARTAPPQPPSVPVTRSADALPISPTPPPAAPAPVPDKPAPTRPAAAAPVEPPAETLIAELISRYEAAVEARNLALLKQLWPGLSGREEAAIRDEFEFASRITLEISRPRIDPSGDTATAVFLRTAVLRTKDGQTVRDQSVATMRLRRTDGRWVIEQIRFEAAHRPPL